MNSEEEFYDAETGETRLIAGLYCICKHILAGSFLPHDPLPLSGLESDDSCEVSFKDALVFESKQGADDRAKQENGVWAHR